MLTAYNLAFYLQVKLALSSNIRHGRSESESLVCYDRHGKQYLTLALRRYSILSNSWARI